MSGKKFTQEILNKIRSFWRIRLIFTPAGWEKCLVKVSFKSNFIQTETETQTDTETERESV